MPLTVGQKTQLKTFIQSVPEANQLLVDGNLSGLADWLNTVASPTFVVWKTKVTRAEIMQNGFDWVRVDNLTIGKARIWEWLFLDGPINAAKDNVRAGVNETWKGTAADLAVRAAVYVHCKRSATRFEQVFATGTGSDASPATMSLEGPIDYTELVNL